MMWTMLLCSLRYSLWTWTLRYLRYLSGTLIPIPSPGRLWAGRNPTGRIEWRNTWQLKRTPYSLSHGFPPIEEKQVLETAPSTWPGPTWRRLSKDPSLGPRSRGKTPLARTMPLFGSPYFLITPRALRILTIPPSLTLTWMRRIGTCGAKFSTTLPPPPSPTSTLPRWLTAVLTRFISPSTKLACRP